MPVYESIPFGKPCWVDFVSSDLARVRPFYQAIFCWEFQELGSDFGNYNIISGQYGPVGGGMQHNAEMMGPDSDKWDMYFSVEDAQSTLDAATAAGGEQTVPPMPIGDQGSMAFCNDVNGSAVGIWQPGTLMGFAAWGEPGYPAWFELHTRNFEKSVGFYEDVLPVKASPSEMPDGMKYATLDVDGDQSAGIWDITGVLPEEMPVEWTIWFSVSDCDASCAKAKELGGEVVMEPEDTEHGRVATIADPTGSTFNIVSG